MLIIYKNNLLSSVFSVAYELFRLENLTSLFRITGIDQSLSIPAKFN